MVDLTKIPGDVRHWYVDDQFSEQLGNPRVRAVVENRWRRYSDIISNWLATADFAENTELQVLDAGCGDGINLLGLQQIFGKLGQAMRLDAIDYNQLRLERARKTNAAELLAAASLTQLPLPNSAYDVVLCNHVLEHIQDVGAALRELHRVVRPGGLLIAAVPNEGCLLAKLRNHVFQRSILKTTDHVHFFTAATFRKEIDQAGFETWDVWGESFFVPHLSVAAHLGRFQAGRAMLTGLGRVLPSQSSGIAAAARVPGPGNR